MEQNSVIAPPENDFDENEKALGAINLNRIMLPIIIGLGVVAWMMARNWDQEAFLKIHWGGHTFFWIGMAALMMIVRHLAYAFRLRVLSGNFFTWKKAVQLVFIWEFSSAVSPTNVGGSAVALFVLSQEKLGAAKTTALVIYSIVVETAFFATSVPLIILIFGFDAVPRLDGLAFGNWTFYITFSLMVVYGGLLSYGLFRSPHNFKALVKAVCRLPFMRRYQNKADELGEDIIVAAHEMSRRRWPFHIKAYLATFAAWSARFLVLNCLIVAFAPSGVVPLDFWPQAELYGKLESLFVILALLPTPGGAGFAEVVFGTFLNQAGYHFTPTVTLVVALVWRLISYYPYLVAGAVIIPLWLSHQINERRKGQVSDEA